MAIYHLSAQIISRGGGRSVVAAQAYRAAEKIHDEHLGKTFDFTRKSGVEHTEIMLPEGAPGRPTILLAREMSLKSWCGESRISHGLCTYVRTARFPCRWWMIYKHRNVRCHSLRIASQSPLVPMWIIQQSM